MADTSLSTMKAQVYRDPRPAEYFDRYHERVRRGRPDGVYEIVRMIMLPITVLFFRGRCISSDNVPDGPVIIAPNHFSFMDHFFVGTFIRRRVQFMAKSQLFHGPMQWVYRHGGVFPVRRGVRDEAAFATSDAVLDRGSAIVMYCEGGRSRTGALASKPKPGIGRLALETGAPIVPVAIHGSSKVRNWKRLQVPKITVQYGEPIRFEKIEDSTRDQQQAVADAVFLRIRELYAGLEEYGRSGVVKRVREQRRAARRSGRTATA